MVYTLLCSTLVAGIILGSVGLAFVGVSLLLEVAPWMGVFAAVAFVLGVAVWIRITGTDILSQVGGYVVDQSEYPQLGAPIQRLAAQADVPPPEIAVVGTDDPFAFAYEARDAGPRIVVSLGLLEQLDDAELEAVLAHELAHLLNRDVVVMQLGFFPIRIAETIQALTPHDNVTLGASPTTSDDGSLFSRLVYDIAVGFERLGELATARLGSARELAADRGAVELTGEPAALSTALETLYDQSAQPSHDLRETDRARLLNITPVGRTTTGLFARDSHPPLEERQQHLRQLAAEMEADHAE